MRLFGRFCHGGVRVRVRVRVRRGRGCRGRPSGRIERRRPRLRARWKTWRSRSGWPCARAAGLPRAGNARLRRRRSRGEACRKGQRMLRCPGPAHSRVVVVILGVVGSCEVAAMIQRFVPEPSTPTPSSPGARHGRVQQLRRGHAGDHSENRLAVHRTRSRGMNDGKWRRHGVRALVERPGLSCG